MKIEPRRLGAAINRRQEGQGDFGFGDDNPECRPVTRVLHRLRASAEIPASKPTLASDWDRVLSASALIRELELWKL